MLRFPTSGQDKSMHLTVNITQADPTKVGFDLTVSVNAN